MITRRDFLKAKLWTSSVVALAPNLPSFLMPLARTAPPHRDGRVLVVIQLEGGNDGINTLVPFTDEGYAKYRQTLRLPTRSLLKITPEVALHPALADAAKLWEAGRLAIVPSVGYPNPSRSHFRALAIWQSARPDQRTAPGKEQTPCEVGWLGQALDSSSRPADRTPDAVFVGTGDLPLALCGRRALAASLATPEDTLLHLNTRTQPLPANTLPESDLAAFVRRSTLDAYTTSEHLARALGAAERAARYPATGLASRLELIARLLKRQVGTRVFYTSQAWYDTHAAQLPVHAQLLQELGGALRAFLDDLTAAGLADRVAVLCFSEFGRRVQENGSQGTDHGTAGPVFLAGSRVQPGLVGSPPRLLDLEDGDLKMGIDFRRVYATILHDWLGLPVQAALGQEFQRLPLFRV